MKQTKLPSTKWHSQETIRLTPTEFVFLSEKTVSCNGLHPGARYVGICGQGPSDHPDLAKWLMEQGVQRSVWWVGLGWVVCKSDFCWFLYLNKERLGSSIRLGTRVYALYVQVYVQVVLF